MRSYCAMFSLFLWAKSRRKNWKSCLENWQISECFSLWAFCTFVCTHDHNLQCGRWMCIIYFLFSSLWFWKSFQKKKHSRQLQRKVGNCGQTAKIGRTCLVDSFLSFVRYPFGIEITQLNVLSWKTICKIWKKLEECIRAAK